MKPILACSIALVLSVAVLSAIKSKSQPAVVSQIRIVTSAGKTLAALFEGVTPTAFGRRSVEQRDIGISRPESSRVGQCRSTTGNSSTLGDALGGAHLVSTCFEGQCAGHYAIDEPGHPCQNCATHICQFDLETGNPNLGCQEKDIDCFGKVCCSSNESCPNECLPGECF
jgi:hypothetical protein